MTWSKISFTSSEVTKLIVEVVALTAFAIMIKSDVALLIKTTTEMKQEAKEDRQSVKAYQSKMEAEYGEMRVRVAILEQRVNNLEIERNAH